MAKLIFTTRYIRSTSPYHLQHYVRYIGTRDGVEKLDESKRNLPATFLQKQLIQRILKDMPDAKHLLEYEDYNSDPTIANASEFITRVLEDNQDVATMKENYVDYLAHRPRAERIGEHGLFTDEGAPVILSQVQEEVVKHKGPIWTHVVSLRREDAERLGYDSGMQWMTLLRSKRAMFAKQMKIENKNLRWYAAFHNEGHHPHVHIMVYSSKEGEGYLSKAGIDAMRSELAHDIFRQNFAQIYAGQNAARAEIKREAEKTVKSLIAAMASDFYTNAVIEDKILQLADRLKNTGGKKQYGYLKADVKTIVDQIVDELQKQPEVAAVYKVWENWQDQIYQIYSSDERALPPLSTQKQFKSIKNMVIAEAVKLGSHHFSLEEIEEKRRQEVQSKKDRESWELYEQGKAWLEAETEGAVWKSVQCFQLSAEQDNPCAIYALGKLFLYGHDELHPDREKAVYYLELAAEQDMEYAKFLLDHLDSNRVVDVLLVTTKLLYRLSKVFQEELRGSMGGDRIHTDRKQCRKQQEKKVAQGHKHDDREPQKNQYG